MGPHLTAAAVHLAWMNRPELVVGATFAGLGLVLACAYQACGATPGPPPRCCCSPGGALYTAGALGYHQRWPNPSPAVFGYHEVFHTYVCAAATCQYIAIALFIVNRP